jgi:hypothetical protein
MVALVVLALLTFTTIRTSPISAGSEPGSSLSKTTPKQRKLSVDDVSLTLPVLVKLAVAPPDYGNVVPAEFNDISSDYFSDRYFSLPPPAA